MIAANSNSNGNSYTTIHISTLSHAASYTLALNYIRSHSIRFIALISILFVSFCFQMFTTYLSHQNDVLYFIFSVYDGKLLDLRFGLNRCVTVSPASVNRHSSSDTGELWEHENRSNPRRSESFATKHFRRITIRNSNSKHITNIHFAQKTICNYIYIEGRQLLLNCIVIAIILRGQINRKPFIYPYHFFKINSKF